MNNSNFGYDCQNNLDNCQFVPIFDEYKVKVTYVGRYLKFFWSKGFIICYGRRDSTRNWRNIYKQIN